MNDWHPILFTSQMVREVLAGRKTQTRRVIEPQPLPELRHEDGFWASDTEYVWRRSLGPQAHMTSKARCPYGCSGHKLWVRETWQYVYEPTGLECICYRADGQVREAAPCLSVRSWPEDTVVPKWRPSIFLPRSFSRIALDVVDVWVERVQDISERDAVAEGCIQPPDAFARHEFQDLWDKINGKRKRGWYAWKRNPWVWAIEFRRSDE